MNWRYAIVPLAVAAIALLAFAQTAPNPTWTFTGDDDQAALKSFASFAKEHGAEIPQQSATQILVRLEGALPAIVGVVVTKDGIDRIIVTQFVPLTDEAHADRNALIQLANQLNAKYNIGCFWVDQDNDIGFQTHITFVDTLSWEEFEKFIRDFSGWLLVVASNDLKGLVAQ